MMKNMEKLFALLKLAGNEIKGRTKFQKIVYILKNEGINFEYEFKYHYFGPYSVNLQLEIDELVDQGILMEENFNPYKYKIKADFLKNINTSELESKKDLINYLNNQDSQTLELVATIYYLKNIGLNSEKALQSKLLILKPNLSHKIDSAFKLLEFIEEGKFN